MTSNITGNQWLRTPSPTFAKSVNLPPRSCPRQNISQLDAISTSSNAPARPLAKKQKLSGETCKSRLEARANPIATKRLSTNETTTEQHSDGSSRESMQRHINSASNQESRRLAGSRPPHVPLRPSKNSPNISIPHSDLPTAQRSVSRRSVENKPYLVEVPPSAPRMRQDQSADFHPWLGHHPEDVLNESTTKNGFFDKPQVSQNEVSIAKHTIWSSLKHKSGIQVLSSLLVSALDQRQIHGVITANCTFKPPPRVTLTDTKREAWLRDLANLDIPLRRLSRTIPHGIRGKVLLDQCLAKFVPISRAVWLAKCVGANEIRAFKRKGAGGAFAVGGESKWIKDWTSNVEQFVENIISTCGSSEWRCRIDYGLRLVSHLRSEHLLDRDHYLGWILSSLQACDVDSLPIWMLVMQIHWAELLRHRQRGRRLVEALLEQINQIHIRQYQVAVEQRLIIVMRAIDGPDNDIYGTLILQLAESLKSILISHPRWFLMPRLWHKYESILHQYIGEDDSRPNSVFEQISKRNQRLFRVSEESQTWRPPNTPRQKLIHLLDTVPINTDFLPLAANCLQIIEDLDALVAACLEWASTMYRNGSERIYICVRLLRQFGRTRAGLDASVMRFLATATDSGLTSLDKNQLYRIVAELLRSKHISPGKYLSWLMARGNLGVRPVAVPERPFDARLLLEMPMQGVPLHVMNLRQILLSRIGVSTKDEDETITSLQAQIRKRITDSLLDNEGVAPTSRLDNMAGLSVRIRLAIASWIKENLGNHSNPTRAEDYAKPEENVAHQFATPNSLQKAITVNQFQIIRGILQDLGDYVTLTDVLYLLSESEDGAMLAALCETINSHLTIFDAMGVHAGLFHNLCRRSEKVRHSKVLDLALTESLMDLGKHVPNATKMVKSLSQRVLHYEQNSGIACSPISDTMADTLQSTESYSAEDIEQILASGISMDSRTMARLFEAISKRVEASQTTPPSSTFGFCELLARLRRFGPNDFDKLLCDWASHFLRNFMRPGIGKTVIPLISSGCLTLGKLLGLAATALEDPDLAMTQACLAIEVFEMVASIDLDESLIMVQKGYRCRLQCGHAIRKRPTTMLPFFRAMLQACMDPDNPMHTQSCAILRRPSTQNFVGDVATYAPHALVELCQLVGAKTLLVNSLPDAQGEGLTIQDFERQLVHILSQVDDFNILICRLKLEALLVDTSINGQGRCILFMNVFREMYPLDTASKALLQSIFSGLTADHVLELRINMESEILSRVPSDQKPLEPSTKDFNDSLLWIIEGIADEPPRQTMFSALLEIGEKLNNLPLCQQYTLDQLGSPEIRTAANDSGPSLDEIYDIHVLLRLLATHQSTAQHPKFPPANLYSIVISLSLLLIHPSLSEQSALIDNIHDTLSLLSDFLSEEDRTRCIYTLRDRHGTRDPRMHYIFGLPDDIDEECLQLVPSTLAGFEAEPLENAAVASKPASQSFLVRRWEMVPDATPTLGENDASLSLSLFGSRVSVL